MTSRKFDQLYRELNPAQRRAVDTIDGPVMVLAGPGTGKTQVLTLRIANILRQTDTPPEAILALAFTRSAVQLMRQRLTEIIGSVGYRVRIHTFHSFCNEVIRHYPEHFPRIIGSTTALPIDQIRIMRNVIDESRLKLLKPYGSPYHYLYPALEAIGRLKKENVPPVALAKLLSQNSVVGHERWRGRQRELLTLYRRYEAGLATARLYDFNDMIVEVIRELEAKTDFRLELQEEHQYLLADEQQDANQGQNELLRLLADFHDQPNLFIVGDEKQAIFQFQGASLDNFDYFRRLYPAAVSIGLTENYRSCQPVLDAAQSLIGSSVGLGAAARAPLRSRVSVAATARLGQPPVTLRVFSREANEYRWLAADLQEKMTKHPELNLNQVAVIFRDNADARPIVEVFERVGLPFVLESSSNVLNDLEIKKLILLFRAIYYFGDDDWLRPLLQLDFWGLPPLDIWRLLEHARRGDVSVYELLAAAKHLKTVRLARPEKFHQLFQLLARWKQLSANVNFTDLFGLVLAESQFLPTLLKKDGAVDKLEKLQAFFEELKNILKNQPDFALKDFVGYLDLLEEQHVSINLKNLGQRNGVRLLTAHKAKGLEFDLVYLVRAYDGHFGARRSTDLFRLPWRGLPAEDAGGLEAERRLFYVALTRARAAVNISYAETDEDDRHRLPSQFIGEIDKNLLETVDVAEFEAAQARRPETSLRPRVYTGAKITERAYLNRLFLERGLSVTALNNYLVCPLKYFFHNLLRVTRVQGRELLYGAAVHAALKSFFDQWRQGSRGSRRQLLLGFERAVKEQPLSPANRAPLLKRGQRALGGYFKHYRAAWPRRIVNEFRINGVVLGSVIKLTGQIDKLEFLSADRREVNVVDYKTGRVKSRNEILGKNKQATGDYYRQLVFYKLLLELYPRERYRVTSGEIDFIEPNERGGYKKERFELGDEAVKQLKEQITGVAEEIVSLKFLKRGCGHANCESCQLWRMTGHG